MSAQLGDFENALSQVIAEVNQKKREVDSIEQVYKLTPCNHQPVIHDLESEIENKNAEIRNLQVRIESKDQNRDKEIQNIKSNILNAQRELFSLKKKMGGNEIEQQKFLKERIEETQRANKELVQEIKLLKRLEHHQGQRLLDISNPEQFPEKLKQLSEQKNWAVERILNLRQKEEQEKAELERQYEMTRELQAGNDEIREQLRPLEENEDSISAFDYEDMKLNREIREEENKVKMLQRTLQNKINEANQYLSLNSNSTAA